MFSPDLSSRLCVLLSRKAGLLVPWYACWLLPVGECGGVWEFQWSVWSGTVVYSFRLRRLPLSWPSSQRELGLRGVSWVPAGVSGYFWAALSPAPSLGDKENRLPRVSPLGCSSVPTSVPPSLCLPESSCDFHM